MQTANRALFLTNYISKLQLSEHLEISRPTFDLYLNSNNWKKYQVEKINTIFEYVKNIISDKSKEIIKIYFKDGVLTSEIKIRKKY